MCIFGSAAFNSASCIYAYARDWEGANASKEFCVAKIVGTLLSYNFAWAMYI